MVKPSPAGSPAAGRVNPARTADDPAIRRVVRRFLLALGEKDYDLARQQLTDTVYFGCRPFSGDLTPDTAAALVAHVEGVQAPFRRVRNIVSDHIVTAQGDQARCHVTVAATPVVRGDGQSTLRTLSGRHRYDLVRSREEWRIRACTIDPSWS